MVIQWVPLNVSEACDSPLLTDALFPVQESSDEWGRAVVEVSTSRVARLPLTDIAVYHGQADDAQYGAKFGAVCFK